ELEVVLLLHPSRHAYVVGMEMADDQSRDRNLAEPDALQAGMESLVARLPVAPTVDEHHTIVTLQGVAVDPGRPAKRQRDGNQMDARPERSGIRRLSDHPCSTASRIRNVMSTVTSKSVGAPESSTFPPARTRSQRVMSA